MRDENSGRKAELYPPRMEVELCLAVSNDCQPERAAFRYAAAASNCCI